MIPTIQLALSGHRATVASACDAAIASALASASPTPSQNMLTLTEPEIVGQIVTQSTSIFQKTAAPYLAATGMRTLMAAVFCHQKPEVVHFGGQCELGDILLIVRHQPSRDEVYLNSLLLQAKVVSGTTHAVPQSEYHQLGLYTNWGSFEYVRTLGLTGRRRHVTPNVTHSGAQYLLIDRKNSTSQSGATATVSSYGQMRIAAPSSGLLAGATLGEAWFDLLVGNAGRSFHEGAHNKRDWSQVMDDLLNHGSHARFKPMRNGRTRIPRWNATEVLSLFDTQSGDIADLRRHRPFLSRFSVDALEHRAIAGGETEPPPVSPSLEDDQPLRGFGIVMFEILGEGYNQD